jgi:hypothetical protein
MGMERNTTLTFLMTDTLKNFEGEKCFMSYDQFDQYASWLPECNGVYPAPLPERLDYSPPAVHAFDGHISPNDTVSPTPMKSLPSWDESTRELKIILHRHPVSPAFLQDAYKAAKKNHGQVRTVAAYVFHGLGDSQTIRVLRSMNFAKDETRSFSHGVCYTRDMRKQEPKPSKPEPKPEPKELGWLEQELKQTVDSLEALKQMGVHKSFLITLEAQAADLQNQVASQNSVQDTDEWKELDRQEREIQEQLDELKLGGTCQP